MTAPIARMTSELLREMRERAPTLADALRQCRNALHDVAIDCAIECKNAEARDTIGSRRATRVALAAANVKTLEDAMALADAALAAADAASQPELTMSMFASAADLEAARASQALADLDAARARVAASGKPTLQELRDKFAGWDGPELSGKVAPTEGGWRCPKCGTDRTKAACPQGHSAALTGQCPMFGVAAQEGGAA